MSERIGNKERIFGKAYGENAAVENNTLDYFIVGGSFGKMSNALNQQKVFVGLGYAAEIKKTALNQHQVIVDQVNTYAEAQEMMGRLNEQGHQVWINQCNCCRLTEEDHLQNRRTDFKIIRL